MPVSADLGPKMEKYVEKLVKSGRYRSKSEVLREGLRLVQERERAYQELHAKIQQGIKSLKEGKGIPLEEVAAKLKARYTAMAKARKPKRAA
jgi:antitoxin ParD1/3/4